MLTPPLFTGWTYRAPSPSDAKARAVVVFQSGMRIRIGHLHYFPGAKKTERLCTVYSFNKPDHSRRFRPHADKVMVVRCGS